MCHLLYTIYLLYVYHLPNQSIPKWFTKKKNSFQQDKKRFLKIQSKPLWEGNEAQKHCPVDSIASTGV